MYIQQITGHTNVRVCVVWRHNGSLDLSETIYDYALLFINIDYLYNNRFVPETSLSTPFHLAYSVC